MVNRFLVWWLRGRRYQWSRLRRRVFEGKYLNVELPVVHSLEQIEACLMEVKWTMDGPLHLFDSISYAETVWTKKRDDCDGFAILAAKLLRQWDPASEPTLVTAMVRPMRRSHTVCAFEHGEGLWFFDNGELKREDCSEFVDVVRKITEGVQRLVCWDVVNPETLATIEFHVSS